MKHKSGYEVKFAVKRMVEQVEENGRKVNKTYAVVAAPAYIINPKATYYSDGRHKPGVQVAFMWDQDKEFTDGPEKNEKGFVMHTEILHKEEVSDSYEKMKLMAKSKSIVNIEYALEQLPEHRHQKVLEIMEARQKAAEEYAEHMNSTVLNQDNENVIPNSTSEAERTKK